MVYINIYIYTCIYLLNPTNLPTKISTIHSGKYIETWIRHGLWHFWMVKLCFCCGCQVGQQPQDVGFQPVSAKNDRKKKLLPVDTFDITCEFFLFKGVEI